MREILNAIIDELKRQRAAGVERLSVPREDVEALRAVVHAQAGNAEERAVIAPEGRVNEDSSKVQEAEALPRVYSRADRSTMPRMTVHEKPGAATLPPPPVFKLPEGDKETRWTWLRNTVLENPVCKENVRPGKKVVLGLGNLDAKIMFVGEAPGADEEIQGVPFVGKAGQLLTKMILAMGIRREDVYIGNIMNWRPQIPTPPGQEQVGNRPPTSEEMAYCLPYLRAQIEIVDPGIIVALGATAAHGLLGETSFKALGEVRGKWKEFQGKPLMVTYHPSYILRNSSNRSKRMIWEDLLKVMEKAELPISEKQRRYFLQ